MAGLARPTPSHRRAGAASATSRSPSETERRLPRRPVQPYLTARALLHGTAFAVLCLWSRTNPGALRRQFGAEAEPDFDLG